MLTLLCLACGRTVAPDFLSRIFSSIITPAADDFVCRVMRDLCPDVWAANDLTSLGECEAKMVALPFADGDLVYVDGNTCASLTPSLTQPSSRALRRHRLYFVQGAEPTKVCYTRVAPTHTGKLAASCMRSSPQRTPTVAHTSPLSPWLTLRVR